MKMKLYHGSMYKQPELMPGFKRSGKRTEWDHVESNEWLYATTEREQALMQGFASAIEKTFEIERFLTFGKQMTVFMHGEFPAPKELHAMEVYLYTIDHHTGDGWQKNKNKFNGMDTEWKTRNTIKDRILSCEQLDIKVWLSNFRLMFLQATEENMNSSPVHRGLLLRNHKL